MEKIVKILIFFFLFPKKLALNELLTIALKAFVSIYLYYSMETLAMPILYYNSTLCFSNSVVE